MGTCKRLVGCQAAFASRLAPTRFGACLKENGRLSGRLRGQASLLQGVRCTRFAFHHSLGRALARLLLILICPPRREAEWRRSSGGGRVAPCGEAAHIERRSKRSRPEAMPPDECRSEGTPSPGEGPDVGAKTFASFGAFAKGSRRKGETISSRYRSNGYVLSQQEPGRPEGRLGSLFLTLRHNLVLGQVTIQRRIVVR